MTLTEKLAEIKARAEKATAGPWREGFNTPISAEMICVGEGCNFEECDLEQGETHICDLDWDGLEADDLDFICSARADVPMLVAKLERAVELLNRLVHPSDSDDMREIGHAMDDAFTFLADGDL